jgi:hypothetical protein
MNLASLGRYGKFYTAIAGELIAYLQLYGASWHLVPAVTMAGAALAVYGVPNAAKAAPAPPAPKTLLSGTTPPAGSV